MKYILENLSPNLSLFDKFGDNCLHLALKTGDFEMMKLLGDRSSKFDCQDSLGTTPLMLSVERNDKASFDYFVEKGSNFEILNDNGSNLYHLAGLNGTDPAIIYSLFSHNEVNINHLNSDGETPLMLALQRGQISTISALLEHPSINVNLLNSKGESPLHSAVQKGSEEIVKLLLKKNPNINQVNSTNKTPKDLAVEMGFDKIAELLQS